MSIDLGTRSSAVVGGRCTGCGRFISRNESHFHSPPRRFRGRPKAHLWVEGGGMVTRCDDVAVARDLIMREYAYGVLGFRFDQLDDDEKIDVGHIFSGQVAEVQRGRVVPQDPETGYSWLWMSLSADAKGPGVTTAVVWNP